MMPLAMQCLHTKGHHNDMHYRIAGNFCKVIYFRELADLHENVGVAYWNACNAVQVIKMLLVKITVFELNEFFTPRKPLHSNLI